MKRTFCGAVMAMLAMGTTSMGSEAITPADIDCRPTDKPVGRLLVASNKKFKRYGEGSFVKRKDGSLLLFYDRRRESGDLDKSAIAVIRSHDCGTTWSDERTVFEEDEGESWSSPVPVSGAEHSYMTGAHDRLVALSDGRLVSLVHAKTRSERPFHLVSFVYTSDNDGGTWKNRTPRGLDVDVHPFALTEYGFWETSVVEVENGRLLLYGRTASGWIYESRSENFGTTWSEPAQTHIPNPLAPMRLSRIPDTGVLLMVRNPLVDMESGWHGGVRRVLAFQTSSNGGRSWSRCRQLEFVTKQRQWFDYPFLLWDDDVLNLGYRAPTEGSFECSIYYQRIPKCKLLELAEPSSR
jgi:hypothetical protein